MRLVADQQGDVMASLGQRPAKIGAKRPDTDNHDPHEDLPSRDSFSQRAAPGKPKSANRIRKAGPAPVPPPSPGSSESSIRH